MKDETKTNPSCDLISRADAIRAIASAEPKDNEYHYYKHIAIKILSEIPSIEVESTQAEKCEDCIHNGTNKDKITCKECASTEVEPKWTCTTNFIAEQLERLKDMTDEERLNLLQTMFPSVKVVMRDATAGERASVQRYIDSISTDVVHGEWIDQDNGAFYPYECSNCHEQPICDDYGYYLTNFCPNCGAKMKRSKL